MFFLLFFTTNFRCPLRRGKFSERGTKNVRFVEVSVLRVRFIEVFYESLTRIRPGPRKVSAL